MAEPLLTAPLRMQLTPTTETVLHTQPNGMPHIRLTTAATASAAGTIPSASTVSLAGSLTTLAALNVTAAPAIPTASEADQADSKDGGRAFAAAVWWVMVPAAGVLFLIAVVAIAVTVRRAKARAPWAMAIHYDREGYVFTHACLLRVQDAHLSRHVHGCTAQHAVGVLLTWCC